MHVCEQCGLCCERHGHEITLSLSDLERWHKQGRTDILQFVKTIEYDSVIFGIRNWIDKTGKKLDFCPFLTKNFSCAIHETKPDHCRMYPNKYYPFIRQCERMK